MSYNYIGDTIACRSLFIHLKIALLRALIIIRKGLNNVCMISNFKIFHDKSLVEGLLSAYVDTKCYSIL